MQKHPKFENCLALTRLGLKNTKLKYKAGKEHYHLLKGEDLTLTSYPDIPEMLELIPPQIHIEDVPDEAAKGSDKGVLFMFKFTTGQWAVGYESQVDTLYDGKVYEEQVAFNEGELADILAELLVWLKKNKYITF